MKIKHLLLLGLIVIFSSCSTAYRTGQTPDDVYYSPAPAQDTYVRTDNQNEKDSYAYDNSTYNSEDKEIRRGIKDSRYRNNVFVDLGYGYNPYGHNSYGYNSYGYNNPYDYYDPYGYNNVYISPYYNPYTLNYFPTSYGNYYYSPQVYISPKSGVVNRNITPRKYNLGAYTNNTNTSNTNTSIFNHGYRPVNTTTNSAPIRTITTTSSNRATTTPATRNSGNGVGNFIRRVLTPENNSNRVYQSESNRTYDNSNSSPARTTQSSSSGSSNSSSGSSSAPVRTFRK